MGVAEWRARVRVAAVGVVFGLAGCTLLEAPDPLADGRSGLPPARELLVVHGLAQTLGSLTLGEDGAPLSWQGDLQRLGDTPADIDSDGTRVWVTLSGENRLRAFDRDTLRASGTVVLPAGSNPIATVTMPNAALPGRTLTATASFLRARLSLAEWPGGRQLETPTGAAPQALATLEPTGSEAARIAVANTAFALNRPPERPFGAATLTEVRFGPSGGVPGLEPIGSRTVDLEEPEFDPQMQSGTNPTALLHLPAYGELLVVGSGVNYGADGLGRDDGTLLVLDAATLAVRARIAVGGSPGTILINSDLVPPRIYLAGTTGIVSIAREGSGWSTAVRREWDATLAGGGLPLIAAIARFGATLYAADFARDRVIVFEIDAGGRLTERSVQAVSDGPVALLVVERS